MSFKILEAVRNCHYNELKLFQRHNYNFKVKSVPDEQNILMIALQIDDVRKRYRMFEYLLNSELVDVLDRDKNGHDVFFWTVIGECERELDLLMKSFQMEIDWSRTDSFGRTILHYAVVNNNLKILECLLNCCAKYKINVDIPDKINKITPYLLACRLNHHKAADLLVRLGRASKNQADQSSFYDAERWKQEGQIEKFKNFLKLKEQEMNVAKLSGNIKKYKELTHLSRTLDKEVLKNPEVLPIIAKVIIDHDQEQKENRTNSSASSRQENSKNDISFKRSSTLTTLRNNNNNNNTVAAQKSSNVLPSLTSIKSLSPQPPPSLTNGAATQPSGLFSSMSSSASSSKLNYYEPPSTSSALVTFSQSTSDINQIIRQTIDNLKKINRSNQAAQVNSLLEMTNGQTNVDHYVGSKSEPSDLDSNSNHSNHHNHNNSNHHANHHTSSHHSHQSSVVSHSTIGGGASSIDLANMFHTAAVEKTGSYRIGIQYNPMPVKLTKPTPAPKRAPSKAKSNLSTFKLISITEESRLSHYKPRRSMASTSMSTSTNGSPKKSILKTTTTKA